MSVSSELTDGRYSFETPEQLDLGYDVAGLGSRFLAALVDTVILMMVLIAMYVFGILGLALVIRPITDRLGTSPDVGFLLAAAIIILLNFVVVWGYYVLFELFWHGQTPGKRLVGLRVIKNGGHPLRFSDSLIRNIVRLLDFLPVYYGFGATVMLIDRYSRRLGDLAAGTLVVKERKDLRLDSLVPTAPAPVIGQPAASGGPEPAYDLSRLTPQERSLLREYVSRRATLDPAAGDVLATKLAAAFAQKIGHDLADEPPDVFLQRLARQVSERG